METSDNALLRVDGLKTYFPMRRGMSFKPIGMVKAVDDVSFEIKDGMTLGIVGESGCGKTTVGKTIMRINHANSGRIFYRGEDILPLTEKHFSSRKREIQMIFQDPYSSLDPRQSAFQIVKEVYVEDGKHHSREEVQSRVTELFSMVGLSAEIMDRYPHELSGGQRQRLGIARALACDPKLIICDEPVSALDVSIQAQIINLFMRLQKDLKLTCLFIAHDLAVVRHVADTVMVMYLGRIVEMMESVGLYRNPLHPYTITLLSAIPTVNYFEERKRERIKLSGEVPSPVNVPSGCSFHPRCSKASEVCFKNTPSLRDVGNSHYVSCHNL